MKKIGMNESRTIHNRTTKLAVLFALVSAMMIVVPMLIEKVNARTDGWASCLGNNEPPFTSVVGKLEKEKWSDNGCPIEWA
jgi:hypothetical protein